MKFVFAVLILFPFALRAQYAVQPNDNNAPDVFVDSVRITTVFVLPKLGEKPDTAVKEIRFYNEDGRIGWSSYHSILDKQNYLIHTQYAYGDAHYSKVTYAQRKILDSSFVTADSTVKVVYFPDGSGKDIYMYAADSVREISIRGKDTIRNPKRPIAKLNDEYWDYINAGTFHSKEIRATGETDTIRYFNESKECIMMIVNHIDSVSRPLKTEYFNYKVKDFAVLTLRYNEKLNMTEYALRVKDGEPSYTVLREYDSKGLLIEEQFVKPGKKVAKIVRIYNYSYSVESNER